MTDHLVHTGSIEQELQDWYDTLPSLTAAVPSESVTSGDNQDQDQPLPYIVLEVASENEWNTNTGKGYAAEVMWRVYTDDKQDGATIANSLSDSTSGFNRKTRTGTTYRITRCRYVSTEFEQNDNELWLHTVTFSISYQAV